MTHKEVIEQVRDKIYEIIRRRKTLDFEEYCIGFNDYGIEQEILSIPAILIKDPDQTLDSFLKIVGKHYPEFLDVIIKENWVKVLPKKGK